MLILVSAGADFDESVAAVFSSASHHYSRGSVYCLLIGGEPVPGPTVGPGHTLRWWIWLLRVPARHHGRGMGTTLLASEMDTFYLPRQSRVEYPIVFDLQR